MTKLADIMEHAGLSMYAEVALVLFLAVFIGIVIRTYLPSRRRALDEASRLPLDEAPIVAHRKAEER
ncbi:MAG: cbb3-type cytochrome c oxidase subunit 3 [Gemmatimonadaceae bacterium]